MEIIPSIDGTRVVILVIYITYRWRIIEWTDIVITKMFRTKSRVPYYSVIINIIYSYRCVKK